MTKNLVIIPTYNEIENIEKMVRMVLSLPREFHILIVDDESPDGTGLEVKNLQKEFTHRLNIEERKGKMGLGSAYIHGFNWGLKNNFDYIFEMDCDFSHNPNDLIKLLEVCENGAELAIGSRYCKGGKIHNWPIGRILMSYFASVYVRLILWLPIKDTTAGFKCYRNHVLKSIELNEIKFKGYAFQIEMKYRAYKKRFKIVEVPIIFTDRIFGESKMNTKIFKEAILGVIKMRFSI